ncbi:amidohydrolase family protein [Metallosphaera hakonensis]|uniref:Amidohydrolase n=1 Tax=Metallosphaera hakonensis JCM 8857 = DSM 7519 TaxID=1293036 RepID=A0A2U9IRA0_9CREN|nr:amidohydrolase family protein [Metallosphaera hakonensis]AWR98571.1 amidohydrolase family protein [Metallosphaera hakonensis JCM 8857 = DSM 7519]
MDVVDVHVHYHIFLRQIPSHCESFLKNVDGTRFTLKYEDVEITRVLLVPSHPCWSQDCSDGFDLDYQVRKENPVFSQWGEVNPITCNVEEELNRQYSLGIVGIKLHPVHHGFSPNAYRPEEGGNENLETIYRFAEEKKLPILIHTGTSVGVKSRNKYGNPILVDDVIKDFDVTLILAHAGRPIWYSEAFYLARNYSNVFLEISSIPPRNIMKVLPRLLEIEDKVMYGSDFPAFPGQDLALYAREVYQQVGSEKIMAHNARKILRLE